MMWFPHAQGRLRFDWTFYDIVSVVMRFQDACIVQLSAATLSLGANLQLEGRWQGL